MKKKIELLIWIIHGDSGCLPVIDVLAAGLAGQLLGAYDLIGSPLAKLNSGQLAGSFMPCAVETHTKDTY